MPLRKTIREVPGGLRFYRRDRWTKASVLRYCSGPDLEMIDTSDSGDTYEDSYIEVVLSRECIDVDRLRIDGHRRINVAA